MATEGGSSLPSLASLQVQVQEQQQHDQGASPVCAQGVQWEQVGLLQG